MRQRIRCIDRRIFYAVLICAAGVFVCGEISGQEVDGFQLYQMQVYCGDSVNPTKIFTRSATEGGTPGRPLMGTHVFCVGNCEGKMVSFEEALGNLPGPVSTAFKAELQKHEIKAAAGETRSLAGCASKCDAAGKYDDYLRKRQIAMELFKHASDLRLTASKLVADWWGDESWLLAKEGGKEVGGDVAWEVFAKRVKSGMGDSKSALRQSWLARRGVPFAVKGWNAIGWIAEAALMSDRGIRTAADYADYQNEAQQATKQAEEMWRKALADLEAYLTQKNCSDSQSVLPEEDRARLERAKEAIEEWDNNQNLYWDPIRNEAVTSSEAIRRANDYLKSGKISRLSSEPKFVMAAFAELDDPPSKKALQSAIKEMDKATPSWNRLSEMVSEYFSKQRSIEKKMEAAFGPRTEPKSRL